MNNPLHILQVLDRHLTTSAELTIFGRAALALGFLNSPAAFAMTQDVDAILPFSWLAAENENMDFWQAQQKTNEELHLPTFISPTCFVSRKSFSRPTG